MDKTLRIALIGQKGIPARYGGIETHVEQIAVRLAAKGHDVSVYCRGRFRPRSADLTAENGYEVSGGRIRYRGVELLFRPSINTKHLDASTHTLCCAVEASLRRSVDIVHFHGIGPSAFTPIPRLMGRKVISTIHAPDWRQAKWGRFAKRSLLLGEAVAVKNSHGVITVSKNLGRYIADRYGVEARYIPNGAVVAGPRPPKLIESYGLRGGDYILSVGRIIFDRGLHILIEAFTGLDTETKLVIVGSEARRTSYSDRLESMADGRVIFTGDLYGDVLDEFYSNCLFYVLPSQVEGLPITVFEAMGHGKSVLLSDIPENAEAGGEVAEYFKTNNISNLRERLAVMLEGGYPLQTRGVAGAERVEAHYNWDGIADSVEAYYKEVLRRRD